MKPYIVILRQLGGCGDVVGLSCVARGLREKYPNHDLVYITSNIYLGGSLLDVAEHNPYWSRLVVIEPYDATTDKTKEVWHKFFSKDIPRIEDELIWKKADKAICLNTACVEHEWPALETPEGITKPRYQVWCEACGVVPSSYAPIYKVTDTEREIAQKYAKKHWVNKTVVGVGLSACDKKRALGIGKLTDICNILKQKGLHPVTIDPTCTIPGIDYLIGKRIKDLMPLIEQMNVVISVDSGILHFAGALGVPVVGIFGSTDYKMRMEQYKGSAIDSRQLMTCAPCWYNYPCTNSKKPFECFSKISVNMMVEETLRWANYK